MCITLRYTFRHNIKFNVTFLKKKKTIKIIFLYQVHIVFEKMLTKINYNKSKIV